MVTTIPIGAESTVIVGRGFPPDLLPVRSTRRQSVVVTQPGPARLIANEVAARIGSARVIEVPDRESAKELSVVGTIYDQLVDMNLGRHDTIVGVGGGAATDVAGFVAATWLRGVECVLVPTTLLGAVDAAVGGKTGINRSGKNLVGAFWHPTRVVVDLEILERLPSVLRLEGSAEIIKAGFIADSEIVDEYRRKGEAASLETVVPRAIAVKAAVVAGDFREDGRRAVLNFGHTLGHAIEILAPMPHGLAVSVGMAAAAAVSAERHGFDRDDLVGLLESTGLPISVRNLDLAECLHLVARDKKKTSDGVRMVLLRRYGEPEIVQVTEAELRNGLRSVGVH